MTRRRLAVLGAALLLGGAALVFLLRGAGPSAVAHAPPPATTAGTPPGAGPSSTRGAAEPSRAGAAASPSVAPPSRSAPSATKPPVYRGTWGSGPGQLGHRRDEESNAAGPPTIAPGRDGTALVLDLVNGKVKRLGPDGSERGELPLTQMSPQDIRELPDGSLLVLDRLADRSVALLGPDGTPRAELPLEGKGIPNGGGVTGLVVDGDSVYAEIEHGKLVRIGDTSGRADPERPELEGRPSADGRLLLTAGIVEAPAGRLFVNARDRATLDHVFTRELRIGEPVVYILSLDTDRTGGIYLGLIAGAEGNERTRVLCLAPDGAYRGGVELPASTGPEETFRPVTVDPDGNIWVLVITDAGPEVHAARCP